MFEILEIVKDMEELNNREQYYIDLYSKDNNYIVINKRRAFKEKHEIKNIKVPKDDYFSVERFKIINEEK